MTGFGRSDLFAKQYYMKDESEGGTPSKYWRVREHFKSSKKMRYTNKVEASWPVGIHLVQVWNNITWKMKVPKNLTNFQSTENMTAFEKTRAWNELTFFSVELMVQTQVQNEMVCQKCIPVSLSQRKCRLQTLTYRRWNYDDELDNHTFGWKETRK